MGACEAGHDGSEGESGGVIGDGGECGGVEPPPYTLDADAVAGAREAVAEGGKGDGDGGDRLAPLAPVHLQSS